MQRTVSNGKTEEREAEVFVFVDEQTRQFVDKNSVLNDDIVEKREVVRRGTKLAF